MNISKKHNGNAKHITNAIVGLEIGSIGSRLVYAYYLVIGLFFLVIALFTSYNVFIVWFKYYGLEEAHVFRSALFLCYVFLNLSISYGFVFCRKWLVPVLASNVILLAVPYLYSLAIGNVLSSRQVPALCVAILIFCSVFITKNFLHGVFWRKTIILSFIFVMLLSLFITKTSLVY